MRGWARFSSRGAINCPMLRAFVAVVLVLVAPVQVLAADFAALTVSPYGRQSFDIATGLTVLVDGGEVYDRERGVRLVGAVIRLQEGAFIELEDARAESAEGVAFGEVRADFIRLDFAAQTLRAEGAVTLTGDLNASAARLSILFDAEVVVAEGEVSSQDPELAARALLFDLISGTALLVGPYYFEDGPLRLTSERAEDLLELAFEGGGVRASTEIAPETVARLGPYLPE